MYSVYKITFTNEKCYIGITKKSIHKRLVEHFNTSKIKNYPVCRALRKYKNNVTIEKVDSATDFYEACLLEITYIEMYDSYITNNKGYNATLGGDGTTGVTFTKKQKLKISKKLKGRPKNSGSFKKGQLAWNKGTKGIMKSNKTTFKKGDTRIKEYLNKRNFTEKDNLKNSIRNGGKLFQVFDLKNRLIGEWINQRKCSRDLFLDNKKISLCLKNKRKTHKGYTFKYK